MRISRAVQIDKSQTELRDLVLVARWIIVANYPKLYFQSADWRLELLTLMLFMRLSGETVNDFEIDRRPAYQWKRSESKSDRILRTMTNRIFDREYAGGVMGSRPEK